MSTETTRILDSQLTAQVVEHIRARIEDGELKPGDKLPPERELAKMLKISRASLRTGIGYLTAMGVMKVRRRVGTFVVEGPAEIGKPSLDLLGALHGFSPEELLEARKLLEVNLAALAAVRGKPEHLLAIAEQLAEMYATLSDARQYLRHDLCFHRAIAHASCNPVLAALMDAIPTSNDEEWRQTFESEEDRKKSMAEHQTIYRAIRSKNPAEARAAMERHLVDSEGDQKSIHWIRLDSHEHLPQSVQSFA